MLFQFQGVIDHALSSFVRRETYGRTRSKRAHRHHCSKDAEASLFGGSAVIGQEYC